MNALLRYCRWMAGFCLLGLSLTTAAQVKTADIEQLRKDMYRLFNKPDSLQQYIQVTNQLIELSKQSNNEELLYKTWSNQAIVLPAHGKREQALEIVKEMSEYAHKNNSKYGLFVSTYTNAQISSALMMEKQAEELLLECIKYKEQYLPNQNISFVYLGLAKIYYNRLLKDKVLEVMEKALREPNLLPEQRVQALAYKFMAVTLDENDKETYKAYYAELEKARKETGISTSVCRKADIYYAEKMGDYEKMLALVKNIPSPLDRMSMTARAYKKLGRWEEAYDLQLKFKRYNDSVNSEKLRNLSLNHSLALDAARAENEAKDLKLKNQQLELEHISDELEQRRLNQDNW